MKKLTSTFAHEYIASDPGAKHLLRELRTFLYEEVRGFGNAFHFRERNPPRLDGTYVSIPSPIANTFNRCIPQLSLHKVLRISYVSLLDSQDGLDVARVTDSWRGKGPHQDFVLFNGKHGISVAQLLSVFTFRTNGKAYPMAYIRPFRVLSRSKSTGYIELKDEHVRNFIFLDSIIRTCVVLSPSIQSNRHVLHDLQGFDMYLRLLDEE